MYCRSILSKSSLYSIDYSINPYIGCEYGCRYCYGPLYVKRKFKNMSWGEYVYAKINAPRILVKELKRSRSGSVLISSITDPYQPIEGEFMITRRILEILLKSDFEVYILTKSPLVLRDLDLISKMRNVHVGFTLSNLNEDLRVIFEPKAPCMIERIKALEVLCNSGIKTYVFIAPFIPIDDHSIYGLIDKLSSIDLEYIVIDRLNIHSGIREFINKFTVFLHENYRFIFEDVLIHHYHNYYDSLKRKLTKYCEKINLKLLFSY